MVTDVTVLVSHPVGSVRSVWVKSALASTTWLGLPGSTAMTNAELIGMPLLAMVHFTLAASAPAFLVR